MGRIKAPAASLGQVDTVERLQRWVSQQVAAILDEVNGRLEFAKNIQGTINTVEFAATTSTQIKHRLGRVPTGYIVISRTVDMTVYDGTQDADSTNIYLQASAAGTAKLFIF